MTLRKTSSLIEDLRQEIAYRARRSCVTWEQATAGSVDKWETIQEILAMVDTLTGPTDCPLCIMGEKNINAPECDACPVRARTGRRGCAYTPYSAFKDTLWELQTRAKNETAFLRDLL